MAPVVRVQELAGLATLVTLKCCAWELGSCVVSVNLDDGYGQEESDCRTRELLGE